ncbi:MAG: NADH-quinone oxidoreductase subunit L, partial [Mycobacteriaceae bacterium]
ALLGLIGRGVLAGARTLASADARLETGTTRVFTARAPASAVAGLDAQLTRGVDALAAAARRLGVVARRPQTGQLHTYFAQAVVALVVLATILVLVR